MGKVSGLTRGDKRHNERKRQLRRQVPRQNAVLGIDLGENRQVAALTDHDTVVIGRKTVSGPVHRLDAVILQLLSTDCRQRLQDHGGEGVTIGRRCKEGRAAAGCAADRLTNPTSRRAHGLTGSRAHGTMRHGERPDRKWEH